jgi:hypothetical protein
LARKLTEVAENVKAQLPWIETWSFSPQISSSLKLTITLIIIFSYNSSLFIQSWENFSPC